MTYAALAPMSAEFSGSKLPDGRLIRRLMTFAGACADKPGVSLPEKAGNSAALEGTYRLLDNENVTPEAVLAAHVQCTLARAANHRQVIVAHDTTEFAFGGVVRREGLGELNEKGRQGFYAHFSFCVSLQGEPLGVVGLYAWRREGTSKGKRSKRASQNDPDRESLRWLESALEVGELFQGQSEVLHVMDREGDSYELMATLLEYDQEFIIRLCHDRRLEPGREAADNESNKLFNSMAKAPFWFKRDVMIGARDNQRESDKTKKKFPTRASRLARLEVRAESKEIFIGNGAPAHLTPSLRLNFIDIREVGQPDGQEPVLWRLVTPQPIDTAEQVAAIIDGYCRRWTIEEFFKSLKTGCCYEHLQLESAHSLLVALAVYAAVAWRLLTIRWFAHHQPQADATHVVTPIQLAVLRAVGNKIGRPLPDNPTAAQVLFTVAGLGGHIKNNGKPGWLVLRRGFHALLLMELGWLLMAQGWVQGSEGTNGTDSKKDAINH